MCMPLHSTTWEFVVFGGVRFVLHLWLVPYLDMLCSSCGSFVDVDLDLGSHWV